MLLRMAPPQTLPNPTPTPKADCKDGMDTNSTDFKKCKLQAINDAIDAAAICMLPLEKQNPAHDPWDWLMKSYRNTQEYGFQVCVDRELAAKTRIYHVPKFTAQEKKTITESALDKMVPLFQQGQTRKRRFGRD